MPAYEFHTKPFEHQERVWKQSRDLESFAAFWEQGTGKSKLMIDTMGHLFCEGEITGAVVVAPNGVHRNWLTDEIPAHLSPSIPINGFAYSSTKASTKRHKAALEATINHDGLAFLAISYDAWVTNAGKAAVWNMMRKRPCLLVLDESHRIKTPTARRTRSIIGGGKHAAYRRILSGTPIANSPFDAYSQVKFLDPGFWRRELDIGSMEAFKATFGVWEKGYNPNAGKHYDQLVTYQNLELLSKALAKIGSRVAKEDVLDLPSKVFVKRYYEMTPRQRALYDNLENEMMAWIDAENETDLVTAPLAITRALRLQQVLSGYIPVDGEDEPRELIDPNNNPRLSALREAVEDTAGKCIIWATWTRDIDLIMDALKGMGRKPVRYDGSVSADQRQAAKDAFKKGDATDFVANSVMSEGLTLNEAKTTIYYNNSYKLVDRLQTEDRNHRIGQDESVTYIDLVCPGTRDEHAIDALVAKLEVASTLLGDRQKEWI